MSEGFMRKMDALDLVTTALKAHEKRLDELATRLEEMAPSPRQPTQRKNSEKTSSNSAGGGHHLSLIEGKKETNLKKE